MIMVVILMCSMGTIRSCKSLRLVEGEQAKPDRNDCVVYLFAAYGLCSSS
jgi:hypothetical protein